MRHEEIQRIYKNHYYTAFRDMGGVRKLVGKVDVLIFFVTDPKSQWTERAKQKYKQTQKKAMEILLKSARSRGIDLHLRNAYAQATVAMECTRENFREWSNRIISQYATDIPTYQCRHESTMNCTEVPILFVFNKPFRSYACQVDWLTRSHGELSAISSDYDVHTIIHELLHQFGAQDLYYPKEIKDLVTRLRYSSVMHSHASVTVDSLSAYLIGWTDEIDLSAVRILEKAKNYTREFMMKEIERA